MARTRSIEMGELTDTIYYILIALLEQGHGYLIMQRVEELTEGKFTIGPASLYTTLKKLLNAGLIEMVPGQPDHKKTYRITRKGLTMLREEIQRKKEMVAQGEMKLMEREDQHEK